MVEEDAGHLPAGRLQPGLRRPRHRRGADRAQDPADGLHHRLDPGRHRGGDRGGGRTSSVAHLELGGKAPVDRLRRRRPRRRRSRGSRVGGFFNGGQDCTAATRVLVQAGIYDEFVAELAKAAQAGPDRLGSRPTRICSTGRSTTPTSCAHVAGLVERAARPRPRRRRWPAGRATADTSTQPTVVADLRAGRTS